jgi:bifunctional non-homologous end joining protein LigD
MAIQSTPIEGRTKPPARSPSSKHSSALARSALKQLPPGTPGFVEPMKAKLQDALPQGGEWLMEVKLDGIRVLAIKTPSRVRLWSRRPRDMTGDYPGLVEALRQLPARQLVVDGEIVALDSRGRSSFRLLQNLRQNSADHPPIRLYLFDLLHLDGRDVTGLPLVRRKELLQALLSAARGPVRFCSALNGRPEKIWKEISKLGLEGIVAKRRDSVYESGRRSGAWLKIKTQTEQEFVIGGYTQPEGSRKYFGSLVVGYYAGKQLRFASRVGTGFDVKTLKTLHERFQPLRTPTCPFADLPVARAGGSGQGLTRAELRRCVWLQPQLVCQVKFFEWTRHSFLRMPVFLGIRSDKKARDVVREGPA